MSDSMEEMDIQKHIESELDKLNRRIKGLYIPGEYENECTEFMKNIEDLEKCISDRAKELETLINKQRMELMENLAQQRTKFLEEMKKEQSIRDEHHRMIENLQKRSNMIFKDSDSKSLQDFESEIRELEKRTETNRRASTFHVSLEGAKLSEDLLTKVNVFGEVKVEKRLRPRFGEDKTIEDLPIELQDMILLNTVIPPVNESMENESLSKKDIMDTINSLRTVSSSINRQLSTNWFQCVLWRKVGIETTTYVTQLYTVGSCLSGMTELDGQIYVLYSRTKQIYVYRDDDDHHFLFEKSIDLSKINEQWLISSLKKTKCLLLSDLKRIYKLSIEDEDEDVTCWGPYRENEDLNIYINPISEDDRVLITEHNSDSGINQLILYNQDGIQLQCIPLSSHMNYIEGAIVATEGNFILGYSCNLDDGDMTGNIGWLKENSTMPEISISQNNVSLTCRYFLDSDKNKVLGERRFRDSSDLMLIDCKDRVLKKIMLAETGSAEIKSPELLFYNIRKQQLFVLDNDSDKVFVFKLDSKDI